jgi:hypothetical protein
LELAEEDLSSDNFEAEWRRSTATVLASGDWTVVNLGPVL